MQEDKTMHNHSATESNIKMTVSAVCENWLGTVSTAQKRCEEENRLLHLVYCIPRLKQGPCPVLGPSCLPCSATTADLGDGRARGAGTVEEAGEKSTSSAPKFLPVPDLVLGIQSTSIAKPTSAHPADAGYQKNTLSFLLMLLHS